MSDFGKFDDGEAIPPCFSCEPQDAKYGIKGLPAEMIAMVSANGSGIAFAFAAPLCLNHSATAIIAGWSPQYKITSPEGRRAWDEHGWLNPKRKVKP